MNKILNGKLFFKILLVSGRSPAFKPKFSYIQVCNICHFSALFGNLRVELFFLYVPTQHSLAKYHFSWRNLSWKEYRTRNNMRGGIYHSEKEKKWDTYNSWTVTLLEKSMHFLLGMLLGLVPSFFSPLFFASCIMSSSATEDGSPIGGTSLVGKEVRGIVLSLIILVVSISLLSFFFSNELWFV